MVFRKVFSLGTEKEQNPELGSLGFFEKSLKGNSLFADLLVLEFQHTQNGSLSYQLRSRILKITVLDLCVELYVEFRPERLLGC